MLSFISSQFSFFLTLGLILFVPGLCLIAATGLQRNFSSLEKFILSFSLSIIVVDFILILIGKSGFTINHLNILGALTIFGAVCLGIYMYRKNADTKKSTEKTSDNLPAKSSLLVIILIFLTIFIKTIYLQDVIFPTATDMGHHMYWTKTIATTGALPKYEKADILQDNTVSKPAPIADFIIGEHLIFAAIAIISGAQFISAFPILVLFLINVMSVLAVFILTKELFKDSKNVNLISILALFLVGPLYALASPQAKFVSGGVIGNTIGNLFIPMTLLLFLRAFKEKKSTYFALAVFIALGMAYTHHLSTFVFIFIAFFSLLIFGALNFKELKTYCAQWLKLVFSPAVLAIFALAIVFVFFIYTPTYLNSSAINTAVGAPSKASRAGLTLTQLKSTAGEARFALAAVAIVILLLAKKMDKYPRAFLLGWTISLSIMSLRPDWLFVDIPSDRIASYVIFPSAIAAAYGFVFIFSKIKTANPEKNYLKQSLLFYCFFVLITFFAVSGFYENSMALNTGNNAKEAIQTYAASTYLAGKLKANDFVLKDHNYLTGDSWVKLFFMRGYNFPFSRGYFKRYQDDTKTREQCTNNMISLPSSPEAQKCFAGTKIDFVMLNPNNDAAQFNRLNDFWQVYTADNIAVFYKAK